jgi:hypothetical protein
MPRPLRLLVGLLTWWWASTAIAGEDSIAEAQRLFKEAEAAFAAGDFDQAAALFEGADVRAPHASVVYNAAVSWDQAGMLPRAADAYMTALARGGLAEGQALESETRLEALGSQLGFVQITRPVGGLATVAHKRQEPIPTRFYLAPGDYQVLLETDAGRTSETPITVMPGHSLRVALRPPPAPLQESPRQPSQVPAVPPPVEQQPPSGETQRILGWVGVGIGALATGAAIYMGSQVLAEKKLWNDESASNASRYAAKSRGESLRTGTNLAWGGAALFGGAGAVLLFSSPRIEF